MIEPQLTSSPTNDQAQNLQDMNEIYNPNPTILKTAGKRGARASSSLWDLDEGQTGGYGRCDDHSVCENIDQNEVFGRCLSPPITISSLKPRPFRRFGQVYYGPGTQAHDARRADGRLRSAV